jgi:hypothetical protein
MKTTYGFLDKNSAYLPTHETAKQQCPLCNNPLGYDIPLIIFGLNNIIHADCHERPYVKDSEYDRQEMEYDLISLERNEG